MGESGSGKTTFGRTLLKLYEPTSGSIIYRLEGKEIDIANVNNENPNGCTPTMILSIFGGGEGSEPNGSNYGIAISNNTLGFVAYGDFAWFEGTTQIASLNSSGDMSVSGSLTVSSGIFGSMGTVADGTSGYSASQAIGVAEIQSGGYQFTNSTGRTIVVMFTATGQGSGAPAGTSGFTLLAGYFSDGMNIGYLNDGGYIQYDSYNMVYFWFTIDSIVIG